MVELIKMEQSFVILLLKITTITIVRYLLQYYGMATLTRADKLQTIQYDKVERLASELRLCPIACQGSVDVDNVVA